MITPHIHSNLVKRSSVNDTAIYAIVFGLIGFVAVLAMIACWASSTRSNKLANAARRRIRRERQEARDRELTQTVFIDDLYNDLARADRRTRDVRCEEKRESGRNKRNRSSRSLSDSDDGATESARPVRLSRGMPQVVFVNGQQQQQAAMANDVQDPAAVHQPLRRHSRNGARRPARGHDEIYIVDADDDLNSELAHGGQRIRFGRGDHRRRRHASEYSYSDGEIPGHRIYRRRHHHPHGEDDARRSSGSGMLQQWFPWFGSQQDGRHLGRRDVRASRYSPRYTSRRRRSLQPYVESVDDIV